MCMNMIAMRVLALSINASITCHILLVLLAGAIYQSPCLGDMSMRQGNATCERESHVRVIHMLSAYITTISGTLALSSLICLCVEGCIRSF
jgi:hypothetical protein